MMNSLYTASLGETATPPPMHQYNAFDNVVNQHKDSEKGFDMVEESDDEHIQKFSSSEEEDTNGFAGVTFKKSLSMRKQSSASNKTRTLTTPTNNKNTHKRKRATSSPVVTSNKKRKKIAKSGNKKHLSGFTVYFMEMSKKARQRGESTVRSKIINTWRSMSETEKDKYTQQAKKSNRHNNGHDASSSPSSGGESEEDVDDENNNNDDDNDEEDKEEEEESKEEKPNNDKQQQQEPPTKKTKSIKKDHVKPKLSVVGPNSNMQQLDSEKLYPEQVEYMRYLMQARVKDYVTQDQYASFRTIAVNKFDQQEVIILMGLLKQALQLGGERGLKKWEQHDGRGFLDSVYKIFQMREK